MYILDIGCGQNKYISENPKDTVIGLDKVKNVSPDCYHDLKTGNPLPFENDYFDKIVFNGSIEHLDNIVYVLEESHRVSKHGAIIYIYTIHYSSVYAMRDPTHKQHMAWQSFDYFTNERDDHMNFYSDAHFKMIHREIGFGSSFIFSNLGKAVVKLMGAKWWERHMAYILPANGYLNFELEVLKKSTTFG